MGSSHCSPFRVEGSLGKQRLGEEERRPAVNLGGWPWRQSALRSGTVRVHFKLVSVAGTWGGQYLLAALASCTTWHQHHSNPNDKPDQLSSAGQGDVLRTMD